MIDWKRKLTSRKFWLAVALFVSGVFTAIGREEQGKTVYGLIMQAAAVVAYVIGEGLADAAASGGDVYIAEPEEMKPPETVETGGD